MRVCDCVAREENEKSGASVTVPTRNKEARMAGTRPAVVEQPGRGEEGRKRNVEVLVLRKRKIGGKGAVNASIRSPVHEQMACTRGLFEKVCFRVVFVCSCLCQLSVGWVNSSFVQKHEFDQQRRCK